MDLITSYYGIAGIVVASFNLIFCIAFCCFIFCCSSTKHNDDIEIKGDIVIGVPSSTTIEMERNRDDQKDVLLAEHIDKNEHNHHKVIIVDVHQV